MFSRFRNEAKESWGFLRWRAVGGDGGGGGGIGEGGAGEGLGGGGVSLSPPQPCYFLLELDV